LPEDALDDVVVDTELSDDGADGPFLGVVEAENFGLKSA